MNTKYCIRHVTRNEVLTHHGFMPRERPVKRGGVVSMITDDKGAILFYSEADARLHLRAQGMEQAGHAVVHYEEKFDDPQGGVAPLKIDDYHDWQAP